jgi:2-iminoacetate synthase
MTFLDEAKNTRPAEWSRVQSRLGCEDLTLSEVAGLLTSEASEHLEELAQASHKLTQKRFGKTIKLYAPIYLSNECINGCSYCGFNHTNKIERRTLTCDEAISEAEAIMSAGHRHILMVAGEHPKALPIETICKIADRIRPRAAGLSIEVQPFDEAGYRKLATAGIDGVTLYQETYNRERYSEVHPTGPKSHFGSRLDSIDAAGKAGMRFIGLGALLGLSEWRGEALALIAHAKHLMKKHWRSNITVSVPRIRDSASGFSMPNSVSDRELAHMICALRLALPDAGVILSTREPAELRDKMLPLGITQMSAGSVTSPGGYTDNAGQHDNEQFHLEDNRSPDEIASMLRTAGYDPVWKDWDHNLFGERKDVK